MNFILKALIVLVVVCSLPASADTFNGQGSVRVEACKVAKDQGRLSMERKYTNMANQALGGVNQLRVGECDCSEDSKALIAGNRWQCIVEVDIASVALPTRVSGGSKPTERQVRSDSGKGDTEVEACSNAKYVAAQAVRNLGGLVKDAGSCTCGRTSGSSFKFECMVDTAYERQK